ncbi:MAG: PIG-L family deacetylase [Chloroflexi bacterium]|nr:PIG-L family deacetylase [Chloroflexota bacterium]
MHLFLSPHLDDIALSCGGLVHQLTGAGERVVIVTVCTGDTPRGVALSEAARHVHWEWQLGEDNPYAARRAEDERVCAVLGAEPLHLGFLDAVYRVDAHGAPLYTRNFIGGAVQDADWHGMYFALIARLRPLIAAAQHVYCPLAIGGHVDHVLVRSAAEAATVRRPVYYEDYPYAQKIAAGQLLAVDLAALTRGLSPQRVTLSSEDVDARVKAIERYRSQQFALFEDAASMPAKVRAYVAEAGGERYYYVDTISALGLQG